MDSKRVYLAGGIAGLTFEDARCWRDRATHLLQPELVAISPLTIEGPVYRKLAGGTDPTDERSLSYDAPSCNYIVEKDLIAIQKSVAVLVNVAKPSWGTAMEIIWAKRQLNKMVVAFGCPDMRSPWVLNHIHANCDTLEDACSVLKEMLQHQYI
jgi:hypothetical protein